MTLIKAGPMKNSVKAMDEDGVGFLHLTHKLLRVTLKLME
jgi:hypothetical protein